MTRRSRSWIGAALVAVIVVVGVIWAFDLLEPETGIVGEDQQEQLRTEKGNNPDAVVRQTTGDEDSAPAPAEDFIEGSAAATDADAVGEPEADPATEGGSVVDPEDVVSPERGEVQNDTGIVTTDPGNGAGGDAGGTTGSGGQTDNTLRETN